MTGKGLAIALGISALLNAFLIGFLCSHVLQPMPPFPPHGPHGGPEAFMEQSLGVLDVPYRDQVRVIMGEKRASIEHDMKQMRSLFEQIAPMLTAPTFDIEKFHDLGQQISAQDGKIRQNMATMMEEIATKLPDEQRVKFFKEFTSNMPPGPPKFMPYDRRKNIP